MQADGETWVGDCEQGSNEEANEEHGRANARTGSLALLVSATRGAIRKRQQKAHTRAPRLKDAS